MAPTNSLSLLSLALIPNNRVFIVVVVTDVIVFVPGVTHQWPLSCPLNHWTTNRIESVCRAVEKKDCATNTCTTVQRSGPAGGQLNEPLSVTEHTGTNRTTIFKTFTVRNVKTNESQQARRELSYPNRRIPTTIAVIAPTTIHFPRLAYSSVHGTLRRSSVANQRNAVLQRSKLLKNTARTHTVNSTILVLVFTAFTWAWKGALLHSHSSDSAEYDGT